MKKSDIRFRSRRWLLARGATMLSLLGIGCAPSDAPEESGSSPQGADDTSTAPDETIAVCPPADVTDGQGWVPLALADYPALAAVGGSALVAIAGESLLIVHYEEGCFSALSSVCTHEGCTIEYQGGSRVVCPCHGAAFLMDGSVQAGPTSIPLETFSTVARPRIVWIQV
jgi:Rieske Fe-S protein